jgi:hypothetical protein
MGGSGNGIGCREVGGGVGGGGSERGYWRAVRDGESTRERRRLKYGLILEPSCERYCT